MKQALAIAATLLIAGSFLPPTLVLLAAISLALALFVEGIDKKALGVFALLVATSLLIALASPHFSTGYNLENLVRRSALFGIISIGVSFVIITGGIDLSIGSLICLVGVLTPYLLTVEGWSPLATVSCLLTMSLLIGLTHGVLITRLRLQPFLVTLCGLLIYRGLARGITGDQTQGFAGGHQTLRKLGNGRIPIGIEDFAIPAPYLILLVVGIGAAIFLHRTIWGRYLLAIGRNETAVRYSGIDSDRMKILAYGFCGLLSGLGGLLFVLDVGSAQPVDFGNFYELYAIAAAVLGGCSLRGGEGTIIGVVFGAAVMQVLRNGITLIDAIPNNVEYAVIGAVILTGVILDESVRRIWIGRRGERKGSSR